ncbi:MAG: GNAT family N-acetyltransferase [Spirochaetota bacterium]
MQSSIDIIPATEEHLPRIMEIVRLCTEDLRMRDLETWCESYPTIEMVADDIINDRAFVARLIQPDSQTHLYIVGMVTLTPEIEEESLSHITWQLETNEYIEIARMGVDPRFQGYGIGKRLFDFANRRAEQLGYRSIRLQVLEKSKQLTAMYSRRGFLRLGTVTYQERVFAVMERVVPLITIEHLKPAEHSDGQTLEAVASCQAIRRRVFIELQQVDPSIELDGKDMQYEHLLLYYGVTPVGCLRLNTAAPPALKIERLAVLPEYRGRGLGRRLVRRAVEIAQNDRWSIITMHAQYYLLSYYRDLGFAERGDPFWEAEIKHIKMQYQA